jgi:hypothetical protein
MKLPILNIKNCHGIFALLLLFAACNHIKSGDKLSRTDLDRIKQLQLLDSGEKIYKFYSQFENSVAGNFFTDKRIAKYWIDDKDKSKDEVSFAYYTDIESIDTVYYAGMTYAPYMLVTKKDKTKFKIFVDGKRREIKAFFEDALSKWLRTKKRR